MVGKRLRDALDREPVWRRIEDRIDGAAHNTRNIPGRRLRRKFPQFPNRNFGGGLGVGAIEAGISLILKRTLGLPFGSDVEIVDSQAMDGGTLYTVDVDAPFENMAQAQAFFEANTGFTSLLTDLINVRGVTVMKTRPIRDTYQIEIMVED